MRPRDLTPFLNPRSIAVVGASPDPSKVRGMVIARLVEIGFAGEIHAVNPSHREIAGFAAVPSIADLPLAVDLAIIALGGGQIVDSVRQCGERGIRSVVILSGVPGGAAGRPIENEVAELARNFGLVVMGPNSLGFWNPAGHVVATFAPLFEKDADVSDLPERAVSIVSQSGGMAHTMYEKCRRASIGMRYAVTTGNEADLDVIEVLEWLIDEGGSRLILLYVEGFREPALFPAIAEKAADRGVAIAVIKVGTSEAGTRAAISHTAHLTGSETAYQAVFERFGVMRANTLDEMLVIAKIFSSKMEASGGRVMIVSTGGGFAAQLADACSTAGLEVPDLTPSLREKIRAAIPDYGHAGNPVDLPGGFLIEDNGASLAHILTDIEAEGSFDSIILCFGLDGPGRIDSMKDAIEPALRRMRHPLLFHSPTQITADNERALAELGVHDYRLAECAEAIALLKNHCEFRQRWAKSVEQGSVPMPQPTPPRIRPGRIDDVLDHLACPSIGIPVERLAVSADDACAIADEIGYPIALKIASPDIQHKTEVNGVALGLVDRPSVRSAFEQIMRSAAVAAPEATINGAMAQKMVPKGVEMAVGFVRDPDFGPLIMLSAGGILIEVLRDAVFAPLPLDRAEAARMIDRLSSSRLFGPIRGGPPADREALELMLTRVAAIAEATKNSLDELEFNPVIVHPAGLGLSLVDVLASWRSPARQPRETAQAAD